MKEPLVRLSYPLNIKVLMDEANKIKSSAEPYSDPRYLGQQHDQWLISRHTTDYIESIMKDFDVSGKPRFYWLMPDASLPEHVDYNTQCSINFILSDDEAPVTFEGTDYFYKQALLNTTRLHSVKNGQTERILLKISIFNETFDELAQRIKYRV